MKGLVVGFILLVALALVIFIPIAIKEQKAWEDGCKAQGGIVKSITKSVTTVGSDGKVGTGSETTYYCIVDGKVTDIR